VIPEAEIMALIAAHHRVERLPRTREPATYYRIDDAHQIGVISTISQPFCSSCDRVRLTATGELYSCLFSASGANLRDPLRAGEDAAALLQRIRGHVWHKEAGYAEQAGYVERRLTMHAMGG
jgi:Molybdenum cofactor biosynthesis enzyme